MFIIHRVLRDAPEPLRCPDKSKIDNNINIKAIFGYDSFWNCEYFVRTPAAIFDGPAVLAVVIKTPDRLAARPCLFGRDVTDSRNVKLGGIGEVGEPSVLGCLGNLG
jgi:hypothetical protein